MKVMCKKSAAKGLDLTKVKRLHQDEFDYCLEVGKECKVMGFYKLYNEEDYHDLLMDRDEQAMRNYFKRKMEYKKKKSLMNILVYTLSKEDYFIKSR